MPNDILILGNGTIKRPDLIDRFSHVVRINSARRGPKRGTKMTQWAVPASMIDRYPSVQCSNMLLTLDPREGRGKTTLSLLSDVRKKLTGKTIAVVPLDVTTMLMQRVKWPTTGLVVVWHYMLEAESRPRRIFVDGFDLIDTPSVDLFSCHDAGTEHEIFRWLLDNHLIQTVDKCHNVDIDTRTRAVYCPHGKGNQHAG